MREHEVPTHVEAEDRVLLWFTFPQIVAMVAVCALAYGVYAYAPVGPSKLRIALAVLVGLFGIVMVVGRVGGRRLPQVVADLLQYGLGARIYSGTAAQLTRPEPPPSPEKAAGPPVLLARRLRRTFNRLRRIRRERRNGRRPLRPRRWLDRIRRKIRLSWKENANAGPQGRDGKRRGFLRSLLPVLFGLTLIATSAASMSTAAEADGHETDGDDWLVEELGYLPPAPVPGRRLFVQGLRVTGDTATVTLRAATDLRMSVRAYGGPSGLASIFEASANLRQREVIAYDISLTGKFPTITLAWEDSLGQGGAFLLEGDRIPYPLPSIRGEICDLEVTSLGWTPGAIEGTVESQCENRIRKLVSLTTVTGHRQVAEMSLMDADITAISGTVSAVTTGSRTAVPLVADGETTFTLEAGLGKAVLPVAIVAETEAALSIPLPPLTHLTHHPERTEDRTTTVTLTRPGVTRTVSEQVTVEHDDGTTTEHTITATLSVPSRKVRKNVTLSIVHPERVDARMEEREPAIRSSTETLTLLSSLGSDEAYEAMDLPSVEEPSRFGTQVPISDSEKERLREQLNGEYVPW